MVISLEKKRWCQVRVSTSWILNNLLLVRVPFFVAQRTLIVDRLHQAIDRRVVPDLNFVFSDFGERISSPFRKL